MEKKKIIPPPKRRKIESEGGNLGSLANNEQNKLPLPSNHIPMMSVGIKDMQIQQAKNYALTEAKLEGWLGNFRSFNSPFGNFLVPVIPTQADLFQKKEKLVTTYFNITYKMALQRIHRRQWDSLWDDFVDERTWVYIY